MVEIVQPVEVTELPSPSLPVEGDQVQEGSALHGLLLTQRRRAHGRGVKCAARVCDEMR